MIKRELLTNLLKERGCEATELYESLVTSSAIYLASAAYVELPLHKREQMTLSLSCLRMVADKIMRN